MPRFDRGVTTHDLESDACMSREDDAECCGFMRFMFAVLKAGTPSRLIKLVARFSFTILTLRET
jgi:hypothetical protein